MSKVWPKFTKENPCPACGHHDWLCRAGERKFICCRVESAHASQDGGWYHDYTKSIPKPYLPARKSAPAVVKNWQEENEHYVRSPDAEFAQIIGVSELSLEWLECGYSYDHSAYTFPMRCGDNKIIGIQLRGEEKKCITGSRLGLFIPQIDPQEVCFLPEGASDTAALLTMGYYAIGRPSCNTGTEFIKTALKRLGVHRAVIVADNDEIKSTGTRPGFEGAKKLKRELGLMSVLISPPSPIKDVRQLLQRVGLGTAKKIIDDLVSQKVWTKV